MRPSKDEYYLNIAKEVASRSTCLRRNVGAVLIKNDQIISTGYNGAPRGTPNCIDVKKCLREELGIPSGEKYELCRSVHAEMNAIINAARAGTSILGSKLYIYGKGTSGLKALEICELCRRFIINAGIETVLLDEKGGMKKINVADWVKENSIQKSL